MFDLTPPITAITDPSVLSAVTDSSHLWSGEQQGLETCTFDTSLFSKLHGVTGSRRLFGMSLSYHLIKKKIPLAAQRHTSLL